MMNSACAHRQHHHLSRRHGSGHGFTIVELLVVIAVILLLLGLLLPAVTGAKRRGMKAEEVNRVRQVGLAWNLYAQANNDAALPGFLSADNGPDGINVFTSWRLSGRFKFPDKMGVPDEEAEEWPWRLLSYIEFNQDTVLGHLTLPQQSTLQAKELGDYSILDTKIDGSVIARPAHIAQEPGFGYNAFYVGGWYDEWQFVKGEGGGGSHYRAIPRFAEAYKVTEDPDNRPRINVVARSVGTIRNSSGLVLFCATGGRQTGEYHRTEGEDPGSHFAVPPIMGTLELWQKANASEKSIAVQNLVPGAGYTPIPIARYTEQVAVVHADMHTTTPQPASLDDQRMWIDAADTAAFQHD